MTTEQDRSAYYITTAIPYVNGSPHVGFALELVQADALARYHRQAGYEVRFLSGTDDNSLKNVRAAANAGVPVEAFVRQHGDAFYALRRSLNLSFDDFIRTSSDPRHRRGVERLWAACDASGDFYRATYSGLYCVGCERSVRERDLNEGLCPEHLTRPEAIEEENVFFRLSKYQGALCRLIETGALTIEPPQRRNEVLAFLDRGLDDFSVSRSRKRALDWGIGVPGDSSQIIFVWFDALANYITALGSPEGERFNRFWRQSSYRTHVVGKGISRFHAIYWPAILLSAGLPLPTSLFVHGYLTSDGQKIGKTHGNGPSPHSLAEQYGIDSLRHYLLHHIRSHGDGDFSVDRLVQAHNSELAGKLGNLLSRTTALARRYRSGRVPQPQPTTDKEAALLRATAEVPRLVSSAVRDFRIHDATTAMWALVDEANRYAVDNVPWHLAKESSRESQRRFDTVVYCLLEALRCIAIHLSPFLPGASERLLGQLGLSPVTDSATELSKRLAPNAELGVASPLFPRID